jgi:hypothetical protein
MEIGIDEKTLFHSLFWKMKIMRNIDFEKIKDYYFDRGFEKRKYRWS